MHIVSSFTFITLIVIGIDVPNLRKLNLEQLLVEVLHLGCSTARLICTAGPSAVKPKQVCDAIFE